MNSLYVKVGIRRNEVEHVVLFMAKPVFPTNVPTFNQYRIKTILCGKVDVTLYVLSISRVRTIGFSVCIVRFAQLNSREVVGIGPSALIGNHIPPNADVLSRLNP